VPVTLARPLAGTAEVRDALGRPAALIDPAADPPTPARVPSGYSARPAATRADPSRGSYVATRRYEHGRNTLVISAGYLDGTTPDGAHVSVGQYTATLSHTTGASCATWTAARGEMRQVCAGGPQSTRLSDAQLLEAARGLH
jgi:hypothetical protein